MKTLLAFTLIFCAGVSSETVDGEGLAKELTAIRDEIGKATGIKFMRVHYEKEIESKVKKFNRDCRRWGMPDDKEFSYFSNTIKLSKDDKIDTQVVKDTLVGKKHPNPEVQKLLDDHRLGVDKLITPMMRYLFPNVEKMGCWLDIDCSSPRKDVDYELKLALALGKSKEITMDGGCVLGMYYPPGHPNTSAYVDDETLRKIAKYYVKNGLEKKLEKLLITKTGGKAKRHARDVNSSGPIEQ